MMRCWVRTGVGAAFAFAALIACDSASAPVDETAKADVPADAVVVMEASSFTTKSLTLFEGKKTTIEIVNNDSIPHDFAIESLGVNSGTIGPGKRVQRTVVATKGAREFACTFHPEMKGRIEVV